MHNYGLTINSYSGSIPRLVVSSSASTAHKADYLSSTTAPGVAIPLLESYIQPYEHQYIADLYAQERAIIQQRQLYMQELRRLFKARCQPVLDNLPLTHPELLI